MQDVEVIVNKRQLRSVEKTLESIPRALPKVMSRAVNDTARGARTKIVRELEKLTGLKQKTVREQVVLKRASYSHWEANIRIHGKRVPLIRFAARQTKRGVTARAEGGKGRTLYRHAFIETMPSGQPGVFRRRRTQRLPIAELTRPGVLATMGKAPQLAARKLDHEIAMKLEKNIDRHVRVILERKR